MTDDKHLTFVYNTIRDKLHYRDSRETCPFCSRTDLKDIIDEDGSIILLKNKFPSLADTCQLVLIETEKCGEDISTYDIRYLEKIITFGIDHWLEMEASGEYKSVVFFKNHGFLSGGSFEHSHMQIVGLDKIDYKENLEDDIFKGLEIFRSGNSYINISTLPNACSTEINIITEPRDDCFIAKYLQVIVRYILKHSDSYNLFFYNWTNRIICKVVPRWVTSPFLVGYNIPHSSDRIPQMAGRLRDICKDE